MNLIICPPKGNVTTAVSVSLFLGSLFLALSLTCFDVPVFQKKEEKKNRKKINSPKGNKRVQAKCKSVDYMTMFSPWLRGRVSCSTSMTSMQSCLIPFPK